MSRRGLRILSIGSASVWVHRQREPLRVGGYVVWISDNFRMTDPISRYRQRRAAERMEVAARSDELLAEQGLIRASAKPRVATPARESNAWLRASIDVARQRGTSPGTEDEQ
jgi:hypothetical protein